MTQNIFDSLQMKYCSTEFFEQMKCFIFKSTCMIRNELLVHYLLIKIVFHPALTADHVSEIVQPQRRPGDSRDVDRARA